MIQKIRFKVLEFLQKLIFKKNYSLIRYGNNLLMFLNINSITNFRNKTFFTKEPETLKYISKFKKNSIFWDIGANVGLYSCFAAKVKDCKVYAFEPSYFNLEVLVRNINKNNLEKKITIVPLSLDKKNNEDFFNLSNISYGSALSSFKKNNKTLFKYKSLSLSLDFMLKNKIIKIPNYIKLDVDGNELDILYGFKKNIHRIKSIILEVDYKNKNAKKIITFLKRNKFKLESKNQSEIFKNTPFRFTFNEIWINKDKK